MATSSPAKLAANRANAQRSTGPRTVSGKVVSGGNATRHGLLSRRPLIPGDDAAEFDALHRIYRDHYQPEGAREDLLLEDVVVCAWRLRRIPTIEAGLFRWATAENRRQQLMIACVDLTNAAPGVTDPADRAALQATMTARNHAGNDAGRAFETVARTSDAFSTLGRYERHLVRRLRDAETILAEAQGHRHLLARLADTACAAEAPTAVGRDDLAVLPDDSDGAARGSGVGPRDWG